MSDVDEDEVVASRVIEPDWWMLARDETDEWVLKPEHLALVERILTVSLFDRRRHVHCCELMPSYEHWPVGYIVVFKPDLEITDQDREAVQDAVRRCEADCSVTYRHVASIETALRAAGAGEVYRTPQQAWQLFRTSEKATHQFAHYGETGVPLAETNDDREAAVAEQRSGVLENYFSQEVF